MSPQLDESLLKIAKGFTPVFQQYSKYIKAAQRIMLRKQMQVTDEEAVEIMLSLVATVSSDDEHVQASRKNKRKRSKGMESGNHREDSGNKERFDPETVVDEWIAAGMMEQMPEEIQIEANDFADAESGCVSLIANGIGKAIDNIFKSQKAMWLFMFKMVLWIHGKVKGAPLNQDTMREIKLFYKEAIRYSVRADKSDTAVYKDNQKLYRIYRISLILGTQATHALARKEIDWARYFNAGRVYGDLWNGLIEKVEKDADRLKEHLLSLPRPVPNAPAVEGLATPAKSSVQLIVSDDECDGNAMSQVSGANSETSIERLRLRGMNQSQMLQFMAAYRNAEVHLLPFNPYQSDSD